MPHPHRAEILIVAALATGLAIASVVGLTQALGAHPFWARQAGLIGTAGGAVIYGGLRVVGLAPRWLALIGAVALAASGLAVSFGKQAFVASFAENALAGQAWYLGWFAVAGSVLICLAGGLVWALGRTASHKG